MSKNYDFHVETGSGDYWIDFSEYGESRDENLDAMNDMVATYATRHGVDWEAAVSAAENCDDSSLQNFAYDLKKIDWDGLKKADE